MGIIFHITRATDWAAAERAGCYRSLSIEREGFIHCSQHYQIKEVADFNFRGQRDLVLLAIDESKFASEIRYEGPVWNRFPHLYGELNLDAVVRVFSFDEGAKGFELPEEALQLSIQGLADRPSGPLYQKAKHYDAMNSADECDVGFYVKLANKMKGPVLDLACGTGRFSLAIAKSGVEVVGLDLSCDMINLARQKSEAAGLKVDFRPGDMRLFRLNKKFNFIFCGFNSAQHLFEEKEFRSFLDSVKAHLAPGGCFAFDVFNPSVSMLSRDPQQRYFVSRYDDPGEPGQVEVWEYPSYDSAKQIASFRFEFVKGDRLLFEEQFSQRVYFPLEIEMILRDAGFQVIDKFGGFDESGFSSGSMKQIFVCQLGGLS